MTPYSVARKAISAQSVLVIRRCVKRSGIAAAITEVLPSILQFAQQNGIVIAGPPFCRYVEMGPGLMTIEPGFPVASPVEPPAGSEIQSGTLPGGPVAVTVHLGPYDKLPEAVAALHEWIESQGLSCVSGLWESYVTDPADHPDPKDWRTEVYWPLAH